MISIDEKLKVAQNMKRFGGSFVQALGETLIHADDKNAQKIKETFPKLWEEYLNW